MVDTSQECVGNEEDILQLKAGSNVAHVCVKGDRFQKPHRETRMERP